MTPVADFSEFDGGFWWQGYEPDVRCDLTSTALVVGQTLLLIDPVALSEEALLRLISGRRPVGIALTNGNHQRDSIDLQERLGIPIFAPEGAEVTFDRSIAEVPAVFPAVQVVPLPGAGPCEHAIFLKLPVPVLVFGDAVIHLPPEGLRPLPDKYCEDPQLVPESLRRLSHLDPRTLCFAHGAPITENARKRLTELLKLLR